MEQKERNSNNFNDNTHRTLQELVSVNAWFVQDPEEANRFTLHADVSFSEERLGGDAKTAVTFKLAVRRCDIIFALPSESPFRIDSSTVRVPRPLNPKSVHQTDNSSTSVDGRATIKLGPTGVSGAVSGEASHGRQRNTSTTSEQTIGMYHELWKRVRGDHAWQVDGRELESGRLAGPVFDGKNEPRLTLIDQRSEEARLRDHQTEMNPVAAIHVRCLRDDIDIYDISFKDDERQKGISGWLKTDNRLMVAREILKEALLREGLVAGDLVNDRFAEMRICDVSISIIHSST